MVINVGRQLGRHAFRLFRHAHLIFVLHGALCKLLGFRGVIMLIKLMRFLKEVCNAHQRKKECQGALH